MKNHRKGLDLQPHDLATSALIVTPPPTMIDSLRIKWEQCLTYSKYLISVIYYHNGSVYTAICFKISSHTELKMKFKFSEVQNKL